MGLKALLFLSSLAWATAFLHVGRNHRASERNCEASDLKRRVQFQAKLRSLCEEMCKEVGSYPKCPQCEGFVPPDPTPGVMTWEELLEHMDNLVDWGHDELKGWRKQASQLQLSGRRLRRRDEPSDDDDDDEDKKADGEDDKKSLDKDKKHEDDDGDFDGDDDADVEKDDEKKKGEEDEKDDDKEYKEDGKKKKEQEEDEKDDDKEYDDEDEKSDLDEYEKDGDDEVEGGDDMEWEAEEQDKEEEEEIQKAAEAQGLSNGKDTLAEELIDVCAPKFGEIDLDGDGKISIDEAATFCTNQGVPMGECKEVQEFLDKNRDKVVDVKEFQAARKVHEDMAPTHDDFDLNQDGLISEEEWELACDPPSGWIGCDITKEMCDDLWEVTDVTGDGFIDKDEFENTGANCKSVDDGDCALLATKHAVKVPATKRMKIGQNGKVSMSSWLQAIFEPSYWSLLHMHKLN